MRSLILFLAMLLSVYACPAVTIMPLGDSITSGFNGGTSSGSYRYSLWQHNPSLDFVGEHTTTGGLVWDAQHQGVPGYSIEQMLAAYGPSLALRQPDVVLILAGTNNHWNPPDTDFHAKYDALVRMVRDNSPASRIIFSTVPRFDYDRLPALAYWTPEWVDVRNNQTFPAMNEAIRQVAAETPGVDYVDLYSVLVPSEDLLADAVHPNASGHQKLADLFWADLQRPVGDFNNDGVVGIADLDDALSRNAYGDVYDVLHNWNAASGSYVPDPTTLTCVSVLLLMPRRRGTTALR